MNNKVFVNGGILIDTPYFTCPRFGARYSTPPDGFEVINPSKMLPSGQKYLLITSTKAPSFFKEYYAKTFFTSKYEQANFFKNSLEDCFQLFTHRENEILELLNGTSNPTNSANIILQSCIMLSVSALDALISDLILFIATKDRNVFLDTIDFASGRHKSDLYKRVSKMWCDNLVDSAEQEVIDEVLKKSYSNQKEIKDILNKLYLISINKDIKLDEILRYRHLIVHRYGRQKNGSYLTFSIDLVKSYISTIHCFVEHIKKVIVTSPLLKKYIV